MSEALSTYISLISGSILIPYLIWVTSSIYGLRQGLALIAKDIEQNKEIYKLLKAKLEE